MIMKIALDDPLRTARLDDLITASRGSEGDVENEVTGIINQVRRGGDKALLALTRQFDACNVPSMTALRVNDAMMRAAFDRLNPSLADALRLAADRIKNFHEKQYPSSSTWADGEGVTLGLRHTPVDSVGLYVPGGKAAYPSSVLMNAIPAQAAGVPRRVMVTPPHSDGVADVVLAAAHLGGITEAWTIGGAHAIAALAFGTESIHPVDMITGPGNIYVATAKKQVFGHVGIDSIAGPSEVLILADADNHPEWIAADLMAQAEHDEAAQSILITDSADFADAVTEEVEKLLVELPRAKIAAASWRDYGAVIIVGDWDEAAEIANRIAPEHVQIATANPTSLAAKIRHAGAIFLGGFTPEAIGDYIAGPNHVLPTSRTARFSSGLGVVDFMKRTTIIGCEAKSFAVLADAAIILAEAEGLDAHALSLARRRNR